MRLQTRSPVARNSRSARAANVPKPVIRLQPRAYRAFRCVGANCEDNCCSGWIVNVDRKTYSEMTKADMDRIGGQAAGAMAQMQAHDWPGNIRELRNVLDRARLFADDGIVRAENLPSPPITTSGCCRSRTWPCANSAW